MRLYKRQSSLEVVGIVHQCLELLQEREGAAEVHKHHILVPAHELEMDEHEDAQHQDLGAFGDGLALHAELETLDRQVVLLGGVIGGRAGLSLSCR